jgi:ubiquitin carboxyl-terminal hydrolase 4/11
LLNSIYSTNSSFSPTQFKAIIGKYGVNFSGYGQQDSQEFLLFLLDGLQEDLNRVKKKPYIEKPDSTDDMVHNPAALKAFADQNWDIYKARNDSVITDLFAGMYKSTVTCPVCDKVSIIFDPFNTLTLQLPIENNWSKEVYFFPLHNRQVRVDVDIDKNASMRALKEFVAKRVGCEPERMVMAESYKSKFYRMFDDVTTVSEANIQSADLICLYEVESVPTNYDPKKQKKTTFYSSKEKEEIPDINSPAADRLLVPIFNRVVKSSNSRQRTFFGEPCYVVITREDAKTYDGVLRKILGKVATMTTKNILDDNILAHPPITTPEDSDTVVMHDDDQSSDSNQIQTASVEGEDGFVDVSVKNTADGSMPTSAATNPTTHAVLQPGSFIPPILQNLFQIKVVTSGEVIPLGLNQIDEHKSYTSVSERASRQLPHRPAKYKKDTGMTNGLTALNSSDEDTDDVTQNGLAAADDESEGSSIEHDERASASESDVSDGLRSFTSIMQDARPSSRRNNKRNTYSRKGKKVATVDPAPDEIPSLIRPGEGILLDWEWDPYDALFEGVEDDDKELRGSLTSKKVELYYDEELVKKRATRQSRRRNGITLDDCLNEFGKEETLSENNAWYCPKCKEHRQAQKKFELWRTPDILVMHLKRFSSNRNFRDKLDLPVIFPLDDLNLQDRVLWKEEGKTLIYDLFAVDNHYGGLGGGHYTAYAQSFLNKEWYEYNGEKFLSIGCDDMLMM